MKDDVINHAIKWCNDQMRMCESGFLIHDGGKDDALATYQAIIRMLEEMKAMDLHGTRLGMSQHVIAYFSGVQSTNLSDERLPLRKNDGDYYM